MNKILLKCGFASSSCIITNSCNLLGAQRSVLVQGVRCLNRKYREERGLPRNPNATGVLTDAPDYSFLDGRATPMGSRLSGRILKQQKLAEDIIRLSAEVDFAVERYDRMQEDERQKRRDILNSKLRPKGLALFKSHQTPHSGA